MPSQTFYNLPKDKQEKIIDASKKEFSKNNFYDASINKIIKDAGISRGSFYQYFENKEDLFVYILKGFRNRMIREVANRLNGRKCDVFEFYLLAFDVMVDNGISGVDKDLLSITISNMNLKLMNRIGDFIQKEEFEISFHEVSKILDSDNVRLNTMEDIKDLSHILTNIMMCQLGDLFSNRADIEQCRKKLINQFKLIKYGVIKNI